MITASDMAQIEGRWITDEVQVLGKPFLEDGQWCALANAFGTLAIIELRIMEIYSEH